jgi:peroxiredoxin
MVERPSSAGYTRTPRSQPGAIDAHLLRHHLIGMRPQPLTLATASGEQLRLGGNASVVAYTYPGGVTSHEHGADTPLADAEEHRGFRDLHDEFVAQGLAVIGISSQPVPRLGETIAANRLPHQLASDSTLRLAELLQLPTFSVGGERFYQRLTFVMVAGKIAKVFYPVQALGGHAAEVASSLRPAR